MYGSKNTSPWRNATEVLNIQSTHPQRFNCVGTTLKGGRCKCKVARAKVAEDMRLLELVPQQISETNDLQAQLEAIASRLLCRRLHQGQSEVVARKWQAIIITEHARLARLGRPRRSRMIEDTEAEILLDREARDRVGRPEEARVERPRRSHRVGDIFVSPVARIKEPRVEKARVERPRCHRIPDGEGDIFMSREARPRENLLEEQCMVQLQRNKCPTCAEPLTMPCETACVHIFCDGCIVPWIESHGNCPTCRAQATVHELLVIDTMRLQAPNPVAYRFRGRTRRNARTVQVEVGRSAEEIPRTPLLGAAQVDSRASPTSAVAQERIESAADRVRCRHRSNARAVQVEASDPAERAPQTPLLGTAQVGITAPAGPTTAEEEPIRRSAGDEDRNFLEDIMRRLMLTVPDRNQMGAFEQPLQPMFPQPQPSITSPSTAGELSDSSATSELLETTTVDVRAIVGAQVASQERRHKRHEKRSRIAEQLLEDCAICCESIATPCKTKCGHVFCHACILQWLQYKETCPQCRRRVTERRLKVT